jgi:hypothetical protein
MSIMNKVVRHLLMAIQYNSKWSVLGITTGNPGVFQANPYPYSSKPVPVYTGMGYPHAGVWVIWGLWGLLPAHRFGNKIIY